MTEQSSIAGSAAAGRAAPFASGREADVFALGDRRVLRRYRADADVGWEAQVMAHAGDFGYPVPKVFEAGGTDMVMERLDGPTMGQALVGHTIPIPEAAATLADLLRRLHRLPPVPRRGPADENTPARDSSTDTIVHLDLHPENILLTARGPVVIDWRNAGNGSADLDTAFSALILAQVAIGSIPHPMAGLAGEFLDRFLALAPGDPTRLLDEAVRIRSQQPTMSVDEVGMLGIAAARVVRVG